MRLTSSNLIDVFTLSPGVSGTERSHALLMASTDCLLKLFTITPRRARLDRHSGHVGGGEARRMGANQVAEGRPCRKLSSVVGHERFKNSAVSAIGMTGGPLPALRDAIV